MIRNDLSLCLFGISAYFIASIIISEAIINGENAAINQFPYQVSVQIYNKHICGGGIIDKRFILTAAHCVIVKENNEFKEDLVTVVVGTNDLQRIGKPAVIVTVETMYVPTEYKRFPLGSTTGDIAVLKLKNSLGLSQFWSINKKIKRLKLPKNNRQTYTDKIVTITGFGWDWITAIAYNDEFDGTNSNGHLKYAQAVVFDNKQCQSVYPRRKIFDQQICAKLEQRNHWRGVCHADSGGPLVLDDRIVIGILSMGSRNCSERERPAVYTRVSHYLNFIKSSMKDGKVEHKHIV